CYLHGMPMKLTPTEYALLHLLVSHRNRIFSRSEIVAKVWGNSYSVTPRAVDTTLARLRHKLGDYSSCIYTHKTCGYGIFDPDRTPA
ncbi:MAG: winged helix-turn-helix domain-containing protein, partial [Muribaculaceae bacterium]|nr:winged helix-turn-helix domain-containing protein [Muribaculaceae bacterium]